LGLLEPGELGLWDIFDSISQGWTRGVESGYYTCLLDCMGGYFAAPLPILIYEFAIESTVENLSGPAAKLYYTQRYPTWFKAGGKYSKVLVPNLQNSIKSVAKGAGVLGIALFLFKGYQCVDKCKDCLNP
jgi:hypothetical protein